MAKATFPETTGNESSKPQTSGTQSSADMRNALSALFQGDIAPLRARAQSTPDMTVYVNPAVIQNFFAQVNRDNQPVEFAGGSSPTVTAPTSDDRIDILYLDSTGSLAWVTGTESATPSPDWASLPQDAIPICLVYCKPTMTKIVNYEDKDAYPNDGYIYRDVRPVIGGGGGADEKVKADASDPTEGYLSDKFDGTSIRIDTSTHKGKVGNILGNWESKSAGTVYQAETDGFVCAYLPGGTADGDYIHGYTDNSNPPTTIRVSCNRSSLAYYTGICFPVKKNDYWRVTTNTTDTIYVYWIPLGS